MASKYIRGYSRALRVVIACLCLGGAPMAMHAQYLRIVEYNIEADVNGTTTPNSGLYTVLEAIGEQSLNGVQQPLDILALEETTSNKVTVAPIVTALNGYYGTGTYAMSGVQGTQNGGATTGNGPNALVYNTTTVILVATTVVAGTPNNTGVNRQVLRYEFQPIGAPTGTNFYVYVCHMKSSSSGSSATNQSDRNAEAKLIIADAQTLPANASLVYVGDFNMDGSAEAAYQTLTAPGTGKSIDPLNYVQNTQNNTEVWDSSTYASILTESATRLDYRDDIQFITPDIYNGTSAALRYVPGSLRAFGNDGSSGYGKTVNSSANTSLNNLSGTITASQALSALTTASDHLPTVADYMVPISPYNAWQFQHFTSTDLANAAVSGDLADPDGDGISNLLEYALNLDPKVTSTVGLPTVGQTTVGGSQYLTLTYTRVIAATGITYVPQVSGDLNTWNSGTGYTVAVSTTNNADTVTQTIVVQDAVAMSPGGRRFMRLLVSRP